MESAVSKQKRAFTLVEVLCVVAILAIAGMIAVRGVSRFANSSRVRAAECDMAAICDAFTNPEYGLARDLGSLPGFAPASLRIANLLSPTNIWGETLSSDLPVRMDDPDNEFFRAGEGAAESGAWTKWNSETSRGWRGPYIKAASIAPFPPAGEIDDSFYPSLDHIRLPREFKNRSKASAYALTGEAAILDPWARPYVLQIPPPQAFTNVTGVSSSERFKYARIVSAGPDGIIDTPCYAANTNSSITVWTSETRRLVRLAGRNEDLSTSRGDDLVLFLQRNDIYEDGER